MRARGFTVIELLISTAIVLAMMGVALVVVSQARDALDRDGMGVETAQRLRAGLDVLRHDLQAAGAGPDVDPRGQELAASLPAIEPLQAAAGDEKRFLSLRVISAPAPAAQGRLAEAFTGGALLVLAPPPDCPAATACGFREGMAVALYDGSGTFDLVDVRGVDPASPALTIEPALSRGYAAGTRVTEVDVSTFALEVDADGAGRLTRRTAAGAAQPIVDAVVAFSAEVFGDALPPMPGRHPESPPTYGPVPPAAAVDDEREPFGPGENCTMARGSAATSASPAVNGVLTLVPRMPVLGATGTLTQVSLSQLRDGPWCAGPANGVYDADLFRIRRVDLRLRVESAAARLRGPAGLLFTRTGHGRAPSWVRDLELRVSLTPPNLEPSR